MDVMEQAGKRQGFLLFKADLGPFVLRREHLTLGSDRQASGRGYEERGVCLRGRARRLRAVAAQLVFIVTERRVHHDEARSSVGRRLRGGLPAAPLLRPAVGGALHTRVRRLRPPATLRAGTETVNGLCKSGVFIANDWTLPGTGQGHLRT